MTIRFDKSMADVAGTKPQRLRLGETFKRYCLAPAMKMRSIIKYQMGLLDTEFRGKDIPKFKVAGDEA